MVISEEVIRAHIAQMGAQISQDYAGKTPLLVGVFQGVVLFMADLIRQISIPAGEILCRSRTMMGKPARARVRITKDLEHPITGRHVLFIEDVIDTGLTLSYLLRTLRTRQPASLQVCCSLIAPTAD